MKLLAGMFLATLVSFGVAVGATSKAVAPMDTVPTTVVVADTKPILNRSKP